MLVHEVSLGEAVHSIELLPLSDFHIGSPDFAEDELKKYLRYAGEDKNRLILLNGDILNNVTKNSVGNVYEEVLTPREQIKEAKYQLEPYKEQIIGIVSGNHERRTDRESGIAPVEVLSDLLEVPYFGPEVVLKIKLGKSKVNGAPVVYHLYATHGWGGGRKKGSKVNNLESLGEIVVADIYCMAHTHDMVAYPKPIKIPVPEHCMCREIERWFVSSGSFQRRGSGYAAEKGFTHQSLGCPVIKLSGRERKIVVTLGVV
jgi:predicted phosphodiesterase